MKKLLTEWRKFVLTEGMKNPADLPEGSGIAFKKSMDGAPGFVYTYEGEKLYMQPHSRDGIPEDAPWGSIRIENLQDLYGDGKCLKGYMVAGSNAKTGWGPLLYDLAMEWASQAGGGLTADRGVVSRDAYYVWDKYLRSRQDVEALQLDINNGGYEKITPKDESDDCDQVVSIGWARVKNGHPDWGWSAEPTAYLYRVSGTPTTDALRAAGKLEE
jgi:hypothetical protein